MYVHWEFFLWMKKSWLRLLAYGKVVMIGELPCRDCLNLPTEPPVTPVHLPVHPGTTQYTPVHLQCYKQRRGKVRQKDRTRATDAAMPINGGARELAHQETHWLLATPSNWHICHSNHCSVFYTQVSFIEDHLFWMTTQQHIGCTHKQKGSEHTRADLDCFINTKV